MDNTKKIRYHSRQKTLWKESYKRAWTVTEYNGLLAISIVLFLSPLFSSLLLLGYLPPALQAAAEMPLPPGSLWWFPLELGESSPKNRVHFPSSEHLRHCVIMLVDSLAFSNQSIVQWAHVVLIKIICRYKERVFLKTPVMVKWPADIRWERNTQPHVNREMQEQKENQFFCLIVLPKQGLVLL